MTKKKTDITIALDAMGGDFGPEVILAGAEISRRRYPDIRYVIHGEESVVKPHLDKFPVLKEQSVFHPCDISIAMDEKPSQALRRGRKTSGMWKALDSVKSAEADAVVSAGNTGALMAMSKFCLRMMPGIERPALAAVWPNIQGESIVLDVGATIGANATIICGNIIGKYAMIGAGSVVTKDIPAYALIVGNPAKQIGWISEYGHRLEFDTNGLATCSESNQKYRLENNSVHKI